MLTIQPKITNYTNSRLAFGSGEASDAEANKNDEFYKQKIDFYKKQKQEYDNLLNENSTAPKGFKAVIRGFKIISEALLEGWALAWGVRKGSKVMKTSVLEGTNSSFTKKAKDILKPMWKGIKSSGSKLKESVVKSYETFKASKFATNVVEKVNKTVEALNGNPVGKYVVKTFEYIGKAFKFAGAMLKKGYEWIKKPFVGKSADELYEKGTKAAATTLGVGAGGTAIYTEANNLKPDGKGSNTELVDDDDNTDTDLTDDEQQVIDEFEE